jgi:fucose permease
VEAISVESAYRRPIMPSFHGWFSVGGFVGAIAGGLVASLGVGPGRHLAGAAAVGVACVLWAARGLPAAPAQAPRPRRAPKRRLDVTRLLLLCGLIAFCAALIEGAIADWSALYMTDALHAGAGLAAAGYAAFACAMAVGRFSGERLIGAIGASGVLQLGCGGAAIALATGLAAADQAAAVAAFAIVGLGVACVFPIVLGAAGRGEATRSGPAVAFVSVVGYTGFLAGPPLIGVIAEHTTLPWALGVVALHAGIAAVLASRLRSMSARSQSREAVGGSTGSRYLRGGVGNPVIGGQHDDQPGVAWMDADRAGGRV